jgi:hypothetical protein
MYKQGFRHFLQLRQLSDEQVEEHITLALTKRP